MPEGVLAEFSTEELFSQLFKYADELDATRKSLAWGVVQYCWDRFKEDYPDE